MLCCTVAFPSSVPSEAVVFQTPTIAALGDVKGQGTLPASPYSVSIEAAMFQTLKVGAMGVKLPIYSIGSPSPVSAKAPEFQTLEKVVPRRYGAAFSSYLPTKPFTFSKYSPIQANHEALAESCPGVKHALISVSDERDLAVIGRGLQDLGYTIVSIGKTASALESDGISVTKLDGAYFSFLLKGLSQKVAPDMPKFDNIEVVVANLPQVSAEDASLKLDSDGMRIIGDAAMDNGIFVVVDPGDYTILLEFLHGKQDDQQFKRKLARKAILHVKSHVMGYSCLQQGILPKNGWKLLLED